MRIAVIDIGNTLCKGAIFQQNKLQFVIITKEVNKLFDWLKKYEILKVVGVSVRGEEELFKKNTAKFEIVLLDSTKEFPHLKNNYRTVKTLGIDRWCNVIGAFVLGYSFPYLVIDLGTAMTVDYVDEEGVYQGGAISPGLRLRFASLHQGTARLPLLQNYLIPNFPGKDTQESIRLGALKGLLHEVKGWLQAIDQKVTCIVTGGDSWWLGYYLRKSVNVEPFLTFVGAYALFRYHFSNHEPFAGTNEHGFPL